MRIALLSAARAGQSYSQLSFIWHSCVVAIDAVSGISTQHMLASNRANPT